MLGNTSGSHSFSALAAVAGRSSFGFRKSTVLPEAIEKEGISPKYIAL